MHRFTVFALLAVLAVASASKDHSLYIGSRLPGDELLDQKLIDVDYKILRVVEHTESILAENHYRITRVEIVDYKRKDTSATPQILSGGPSNTYVTVKFISERGHGIHYILKVYGKRVY